MGNGEPTGQPLLASMPKTYWFRAPAHAKIVLSHPRIFWETAASPRPQEKTYHTDLSPYQPFITQPPSSGLGLGTMSLLLRQGVKAGLCTVFLHYVSSKPNALPVPATSTLYPPELSLPDCSDGATHPTKASRGPQEL